MLWRIVVLAVAVVASAAKPADRKAEHALNRLTFGPRPGDLERVKSIGLKKWIELQLHPERIPENAALETRLRSLDTLTLSAAVMVQAYPPPNLLRAMAAGAVPLPTDPERRRIGESLRQIAQLIKADAGVEVALPTSAAGTTTRTRRPSSLRCWGNSAARSQRSGATSATAWKTS